jgi:FKBP-type peptidyl-prolyl cis-trans isomerase SlyD
MKAEKDSVVTFHYELTDENGQPIESSRRSEPLVALLGHGGIIAGVEAALMGREAGDAFKVEVSPEQGYGERHDDRVQRVPKKYFKAPDRLKPGMQTVLHTQDGHQRLVTVRKVGSSVIDVDLNHPLAGRRLNFDIEIVSVRQASPEELEHGHAHGPGGHQHA